MITFGCKCGQALEMPESAAGTWVQCPACGVVTTVPSESSPVRPKPQRPVENNPGAYAGAPTSPPSPMDNFVPTQAFIPEKFRAPGKPPCYLVLITRGAVVNAGFDIGPVMKAFAEGFAKKVHRQYDVQIVPKAPDGAPCAVVRLAQIDEGNQLLRYVLTFLAGKTILEITGHVRSASGTEATFQETHKGTAGLLGGSSLNLLKASGKYLGARIGKKVLK